MPTATSLLVFATGLLLGVILGGFAALACSRRVSERSAQPAPEPPDLRPIAHSLEQLHAQLGQLEKEQAVTTSTLAGQVQAIGRTSARLGTRTDQLIAALRSPATRGRWGEIQLQRVVELGGMLEHVDFDTQQHMLVDDHSVRPDMIIRLSQGRSIVVDAKVPFSSYLDALNTEDPEEQQAYMRRHAHLLRAHVDTLSSKRYIEAFQPTPEFVVMFVPADPFLDAGLQIDPELLEYAFARDVVIATPTTLFALLRTVALSWRQDSVNEKAKEIQRLGAELHHRLGVMAGHYNRVGSSLEKAVEAFNATLASMDTRVMVTARKLEEFDVPLRRDTAAALRPVSASPRRSDPATE